MFDKLSSILVAGDKNQVLPQFAKTEVLQHLTLGNEFRQCFHELSDVEFSLKST